MKSILYTLPLALLFSFTALADSDKTPVQLDIASGNVPGQIQTIQKAIHEPRYSEMSADDKSALNQQLAALQQGQLDSVGTAKAQEQVNSILSKAYADSRMVCNLKKRTCKTVAAKKKQHQNTQSTSDINNPVMSAGN